MKQIFLLLFASAFGGSWLTVFSQNVGIGTTTPTRAKLEVHGGVGATSAIFGGESSGISLQRNWPTVGFNQYYNGGSYYMADGYAAAQYFSPGEGYLAFDIFPNGIANTIIPSYKRVLSLSKEGNAGIAGAFPNSEIQLPNILNNRKITLWEANNNPYEYFGFGIQSGTLTYNIPGTGDRHMFYAGNGPAASARLMSIGGNGKVAIGVWNGMGKLGINSEDPQFTLELMQADHTGLVIVDANTFNSWELKTETVFGPNYLFFRYRDNLGQTGGGAFIDNNGDFHNGSDYRLKKNIQALPDVLPRLLQLQPKAYNMNNNPADKKNIGFIAQDLKKFFPELVSVVDGTAAGYKEIEDLHAINYSGLSVLAIKAIQEQQIIIEVQQKQIDELVKRIEALEKQ